MIRRLFRIHSLVLIATVFACQSPEKKPSSEDAPAVVDDKKQEVNPIKETIDSLSQAIAQQPKNTDALVARGNAYLDYKNPAYARADADAAFYLDSSREDVLLLRGDVHYVLNKTRQSRNMWERCGNLFPNNTECRLRIAELYLAIQDLDNALKRLNEILEIDERNATALFMKGVIIRDRNADTAMAMQYFQRAIDLRDGHYVEALDMMGVMLSHKGDPMAVQYFKNAIQHAPNRDDLYHKLGLAYANQEEYNNALEAYQQAIQLNPRNDEVHFNIGFINISLQNYDLAIDNFNSALDIREMNIKALYGRAFAYEMRGDITNASRDYQSCLTMFPDYEPAQIGLQRIERMKQK